MIELVNVKKTYTQGNRLVEAVKGISLELKPGETLGIVGESGSGKSTLLQLIQLMEKPTSGEILFNGESSRHWSEKRIRKEKKQMSMLFQHFNLLGNLKVIDNVLLPLKIQGNLDVTKGERLLEFVGLAHKKNDYPSQLSGGEKQRVALARALVTQPKWLLLDEATSALDLKTTNSILLLLEKVKKEYAPGIIFVSHDLEVIKKSSERVLIMEKGQFVDTFVINQLTVEEEQESYSEKAQRVLRR